VVATIIDNYVNHFVIPVGDKHLRTVKKNENKNDSGKNDKLSMSSKHHAINKDSNNIMVNANDNNDKNKLI
jgi:hypothetical protein